MALEPEPEPELDAEGNPVEPPEPEPEPEPELDADRNPIVPVPDPELSELFPNVPLASAVFDLSMLTLPAPETSSTLPNLAGVPFAWRWPACPSVHVMRAQYNKSEEFVFTEPVHCLNLFI